MIPVEPMLSYLLDIIDDSAAEKSVPERIAESHTPLLTLARRLKIAPWVTYHAARQWGDILPSPVLQVFASEYEKNRVRSAAILHQIKNISEHLREQNIRVMFIKGAAVLLRGFYPFGCRFMTDIDILVAPDDAESCFEALAKTGYEEIPGSIAQVHHAPLMMHHSLPAAVEVHTAPYPMLIEEQAAAPVLWESSLTVRLWGSSLLVPSDTDHAWLLIRSDPLSQSTIPRPAAAIELASFIESGASIDYAILQRRAVKDAIPGCLRGMNGVCRRFFGISFSPDNEESLELWFHWSRYCMRKKYRYSHFVSARERFTAFRFYPDKGLGRKCHFIFRMMKMVDYIDRFTPGELREPSLFVKIFRSLKVAAGLVLIGMEFALFRLSYKTTL